MFSLPPPITHFSLSYFTTNQPPQNILFTTNQPPQSILLTTTSPHPSYNHLTTSFLQPPHNTLLTFLCWNHSTFLHNIVFQHNLTTSSNKIITNTFLYSPFFTTTLSSHHCYNTNPSYQHSSTKPLPSTTSATARACQSRCERRWKTSLQHTLPCRSKRPRSTWS